MEEHVPVEVEITEIPDLSEVEQTLVDMHSILNTLNILMGEIQFLGLEMEDPEVLQPSLQALERGFAPHSPTSR